MIARASEALIFVKALILCNIKGNLMHTFAKFLKSVELCLNFETLGLSDLLLAAWAIHELKIDLEGTPAVLK